MHSDMWHRRFVPRRLIGRATSQSRLLAGVRVALLALCAGLAGLTGEPQQPAIAVGALAVAAVVGSLPAATANWHLALLWGETVIVAVTIGEVRGDVDSLLPYLLAPAFAAGLMGGALWPLIIAASADLIISGQALLVTHDDLAAYFSTLTTWVLLSVAVGLLGAWIRRLREQSAGPVDPSYAAAYRLLSQLHMVSRQLSAGLDPVALAQSLLEKIREHLPFERAAIFVRSPGGRLVPLAMAGAEHLEWDTELAEDSPLFEAWTTAEPVQRAQSRAGIDGHSVILPLRFGVRNFGLVAMDVKEPASRADIERINRLAAEAALPLETALLFADIRSIATAEERRRLAREIHDGVAQELAALGYAVDELTAQARYLPELERDLTKLRDQITRLVSELRFSIFDLRSEVASAGLATTLADYVRQVGAGSNLTIHLILDATPARLRLDTEAELLRIAQEAVTNVRKHARAENLWVTCRVAPPTALVRVEDDGEGLGTARVDSFGMEIMRERAVRIGADLRVEGRPGGGTVVEVQLGALASTLSRSAVRAKEEL